VIAPPPFPVQPKLESLAKDKNDKTGEPGYWLNRQDLNETAGYMRKIEVLKREWKPD
jgi:hypothetical protein